MKTLVAAAVLLAPVSAWAVEVTGHAILNPIGYVAGAGVEIGLGPNGGIEVMGSSLSYDYYETGYEEWGTGTVLGVRARYYAQDTGNASRLWLGGGLSFAQVAYEWEERDGGVLTDSDEGTTSGVLVTGGVGYKVLLGDERFTLDPQLYLGYLTGADTDANLIGGLGLSAGVRF